jgi:hypothetical protein
MGSAILVNGTPIAALRPHVWWCNASTSKPIGADRRDLPEIVCGFDAPFLPPVPLFRVRHATGSVVPMAQPARRALERGDLGTLGRIRTIN